MVETRERMGVGQRLRELRQAAGLSQGQLALASGLEKMSISQIERGVRLPTLATLSGLVHGLGVPLAAMHPPTQVLPSWPEGCERPESEGDVGKRLRALRRIRGMTQVQLSQTSGIKQQCISRIEAAKDANISWPVLVALATALQVSLDAFAKGRPGHALGLASRGCQSK